MLEHRLQERLAESTGLQAEAKTHGERLYLAYQAAKQKEREGAEEAKALRAEIDELMGDGELVGFPDAYLALQERTTYECDMDALVADVGEKVALRVCEVSSTKLKKLMETGLVSPDATYITTKVATSLVTRTNRQSK